MLKETLIGEDGALDPKALAQLVEPAANDLADELAAFVGGKKVTIIASYGDKYLQMFTSANQAESTVYVELSPEVFLKDEFATDEGIKTATKIWRAAAYRELARQVKLESPNCRKEHPDPKIEQLLLLLEDYGLLCATESIGNSQFAEGLRLLANWEWGSAEEAWDGYGRQLPQFALLLCGGKQEKPTPQAQTAYKRIPAELAALSEEQVVELAESIYADLCAPDAEPEAEQTDEDAPKATEAEAEVQVDQTDVAASLEALLKRFEQLKKSCSTKQSSAEKADAEKYLELMENDLSEAKEAIANNDSELAQRFQRDAKRWLYNIERCLLGLGEGSIVFEPEQSTSEETVEGESETDSTLPPLVASNTSPNSENGLAATSVAAEVGGVLLGYMQKLYGRRKEEWVEFMRLVTAGKSRMWKNELSRRLEADLEAVDAQEKMNFASGTASGTNTDVMIRMARQKDIIKTLLANV